MSSIHTKLRSMPRSKTPSAVYIQMHQLANQRERLQEELKRLSDRTVDVYQQLQELELNLNRLESEATQYNSTFEPLLNSPNPILNPQNSNYQIKKSQASQPQTNHQSSKYQSFIIEY